ncbi:MAG: hypothetical protein ACTSYA_00225 [Candidatus Kariarchaeaceae archaeon]
MNIDSIDHKLPPNLEKTILDSLPIGISVQTIDLTLIYENKAMVNMVGSYLGVKCWNRWNYLTSFIQDYVPGQCVTCPHRAVEVDHKTHTEFREIINPKGETLFIEITHIPLFNDKGKLAWFIETIKDVSASEKARLLSRKLVEADPTKVKLGLIRFGDDLSNKIIFTDELNFIKEEVIDTFYIKILSYYFVILGQGNKVWKNDIFGPLPILDYIDYQSLIYTFTKYSDTVIDIRMDEQDYLMLLFMMPRDCVPLFNSRAEILKMLNSFFSKYSSVEEIQEDSELMNSLQEEINLFLSKEIS